MLKLKRIDSYIIKNFIKFFVITFFVCLFIILMQSLWQRIDDLVGKGLPIGVLAELFFYIALSMTPIALPLAILLASLMTFGNMGERLELLAMKSAGISLFRIMRSLIIFISFIVVGAFFFSNNVIPIAQKRMWTLLFSIRQKSPELDIPVGEFYSGIPKMNLYVRSKNHKTKALCNVMIYDYSQGFDNATVTTADSVHIRLTQDKLNLVLELYDGEYFENLRQQVLGSTDNIPYRRETFKRKDLLLDFDANFTKMDESVLNNQHISKNIIKLTHDIDSINVQRDSLRCTYVKILQTQDFFTQNNSATPIPIDLQTRLPAPQSPTHTDSLFYKANQENQALIASVMLNTVQNRFNDITMNSITIEAADNYFARHDIEWHQKFTLSFACLIFFFIGAPLGAIIGKGGFGIPAVISILFFLVYYIINTTGIKMAREMLWPVWQGMWLSSAILLPIGIFLTYKAATESAIFNADSYKILWKKLQKALLQTLRRKPYPR